MSGVKPPTAGRWIKSLAWLAVVLAWGGTTPAQPTPASPPIERGTFHLFKFEQDIGREHYQIVKEGNTYRLTSHFKFTDRGTPVPLASSLRYASDLSALSLGLKGRIARATPIDDSIEVRGTNIYMRLGDQRRHEARPRDYFLLASYAPTAVQMLLMRYWRSHATPAQMMTFPLGPIRIERRGTDTVMLNGRAIVLERYLAYGVVWGREAIWLDAQHQLIALVGIDAEFDHFESIRDGYEGALATLVTSAGQDEMAALAEIGGKLPGIRAPRVALVGATVIDGTGAAPRADATIVIDGDRITTIGPRSQTAVPADATVIDVTGKTILPGLWDMHAHFEQVEWGSIYLAAGVTTVRDCGNEFEFITAVRDAIAQKRGLGPRILAAGLVDGKGPYSLGVQYVDDAGQAKYWVDRYHAAGFSQMKIYSSMKRESVAAVARDAHGVGMSVTGHIPDSMTLQEGIDAGMDQVNHIGFILEDMAAGPLPDPSRQRERAQRVAAIDVESDRANQTVAFLREHDIVVDPTVALSELATASSARPYASFEPGVLRLAPELAAIYGTPPASSGSDPMPALMASILQKELRAIGALHRAGVTIVAGTDQGVPGFSLYRELELYVQAGLTPMEAIQAATSVPARVMKLDGQLGALQPGKIADLIVLGKNPLESIDNIRSVEKVVTAGVLYETGPLWESVGFKR